MSIQQVANVSDLFRRLLVMRLFTLLSLLVIVNGNGFQPEQVHLSYGVTPDQMTVSWLTQAPCAGHVEYGTSRALLNKKVPSKATHFKPAGSSILLKSYRWLHTATMIVAPGAEYYYHVGSDHGLQSTWSDLFSFRASKADASPRTAIVFGDMGAAEHACLAAIQNRAQRGLADAIFHIGDFAYDMATENSENADAFMRRVQPAAAYLPYMTCPGNHEYHTIGYDSLYNASDYRNRFVMPGDAGGRNLYFAFNFGSARVISVNTEVYYDEPAQKRSAVNELIEAQTQYNWLEQELARANSLSERKMRPWIIVLGHRPMYCSGKYRDCWMNRTRLGIPVNGTKKFGLEQLFRKFGVDIFLVGHLHNYERILPVYNETVPKPINASDPYFNPGGLVQLVTGAAGSKERFIPFFKNKRPWDVVRIANRYTYTTMQVSMASVVFEQLDNVDRKVDGFVVTKTWKNHRPTWLQPKRSDPRVSRVMYKVI